MGEHRTHNCQRYDQTIVYFLELKDDKRDAEGAAIARALKVFKIDQRVHYIARKNADLAKSVFGQSTSKTRIYLCAHGTRSSFADFDKPEELAKHLTDLGLRQARQITLSGCHSGEEGFAADFLKALFESKPPVVCVVYGYVGVIRRKRANLNLETLVRAATESDLRKLEIDNGKIEDAVGRTQIKDIWGKWESLRPQNLGLKTKFFREDNKVMASYSNNPISPHKKQKIE